MTIEWCEELLSPPSKFFKKLIETPVWALKRSTIRCLGFAERERDLCLVYFSSFFPHKIGKIIQHPNSIKQTLTNQ